VIARLCDRRVRSSHDTIAKALEGDYRSEHLFALSQSLAGYRYYQRLIAEVDQEMKGYVGESPHRIDAWFNAAPTDEEDQAQRAASRTYYPGSPE
jgi:transposase